MKGTINVLCYKSKTLANGENPLVIRVCKDNKKKYQSLGISVNPKFWDFDKNRPKPNCPNKELILKIILEKETEYQKQILEFQSDKKDYTATTLLLSKKENIKSKTVSDFYEEIVASLNAIGKTGNAKIYKDSHNSLKRFYGNKLEIPFSDIDVIWLNNYEQFLRGNKCNEVSISTFFRTLRGAYNRAIKAKIVKQEFYPFNEFKLSKFDTSTEKRAISKNEILQIINADLTNSSDYVRLSQDLFTFSYLCGGINFVDMANLKQNNVTDNRVIYVRQKTGKKINVPLNEKAQNIINKYVIDKDTADYIFPILDKTIHKTEQQKHNRRHKVLAHINKNLKAIATKLEISTDVTTYVARHSFATVLKRSGVATSIISETLGHSSEKVTQIYLDSFENTQIDAAMANLL
ncbi:MAG: site-specific integrase [Prevotellaceae bacterium]|jgi:site-specific recombinase XerD|nr:site-specific integrase [Prevotellaceae bacterium]